MDVTSGKSEVLLQQSNYIGSDNFIQEFSLSNRKEAMSFQVQKYGLRLHNVFHQTIKGELTHIRMCGKIYKV